MGWGGLSSDNLWPSSREGLSLGVARWLEDGVNRLTPKAGSCVSVGFLSRL